MMLFFLATLADSEAAPPSASKSAGQKGYVGSQKCKTCHSDKYAEWKGTMHSRMVQEFTVGSTDANFAIAPFKKSDVKFVIGGMDEYDFVGKKDLKLIPFFWDMGKREWVKQDVYNWIGECTQCHTTGWDAKTRTWSELAIACEACHGPGRDHVASEGKAKVIRSVSSDEMCGRCHNGTEKEPRQGVRLATNHGKSLATLKAAPDAKNECLQCHSQDYREASLESKPTLAEAKYAVTCVTCHDPHKRTGHPGQLKAESNELCMTCHTAGKILVSSEVKVSQPQKEMIQGNIGVGLEKGLVNSAGIMLAPVPNSPIKKKVTCSDCHMKYDVPRSAGTMPNHLFKAGTPAGSYLNHFGETVKYNSCAGCHASMTQERFDAYQKETKDMMAAVAAKLSLAQAYRTQAKDADRALYEHAGAIVAFVKADGSLGIHNYGYTKELLRAADIYVSDFLVRVPAYAK
jgi:predicted CXXCH cytochrome family protein